METGNNGLVHKDNGVGVGNGVNGQATVVEVFELGLRNWMRID